MTESPLKFIEGNCESSTACALSDSEFGTLRFFAETLNETEEKKLEKRGAETRRTSIHATVIARCLFLISALRGSKNEWFVFTNGHLSFVPNLSRPRQGKYMRLNNCRSRL